MYDLCEFYMGVEILEGTQMKIALLLAVLSVSLASLPAHAQATRTWVSGVGDDANPCSRTAPCKTFAGAISKTAAGGQINVLDPGGFGAVTITKAITINSEFIEAGVLVSGTNAIIINAGVNDRVVLRGLDIEGLGTGLNGIRFLAGASLQVQKCMIRNFRGAAPNGNGISFTPSGASELFVDDCTISSNGTDSSNGGITIRPTGTGSATAVLNRVSAENNSNGIMVDGDSTTGQSTVSIRDSYVAGNRRTESSRTICRGRDRQNLHHKHPRRQQRLWHSCAGIGQTDLHQQQRP